MSEWRVEVVRVGPVEAHPDADRLEITRVHGGYPCIVAKGQLSEGARAVYLPVDSLVPADEERWAFLGRGRTPTVVDGRPYWRIRALRLRGVFSMGVLVGVPADMADAEAGDLVHERLGVLKYEPPEPVSMGGENERDPGFLPHYDVEALRRHPDVLIPGEDVVVTEKIHGASGRWAWREGRLWVAQHACFKKAPADGVPPTIWWRIAEQYDLAWVMKNHPGLAMYGEVYGQVQDLKYGVQQGGLRLAVFDILDIQQRRWLDFDEAQAVVADMGLPWVPVLHRGPWSPDLARLAEGRSALANHVREGMVVRPTKERFDERVGRGQLKLHGEGYLTRKEGKDG